jgi:DNA-binding transcriptional LysR family regulator
MNTEALLTFLQVAETGSFSIAAQSLRVTQSTISSRVQSLEQELGCVLFVRNRAGTVLTAEGEALLKDAREIIGLWDSARRRVSIPPGIDQRFRFGTPTTFDEEFGTRLVLWFRKAMAGTAVHIEAGSSGYLLDAVASHDLDAAVLFLPAHRPGLLIEQLYEEELVLVASDAMQGQWQDNFIDVTWGSDFSRAFALAFPNFPAPSLSVGLGMLGARYLVALKGAAYVTRSQAKALLASGLARMVVDTPTFKRPLFLAYSQKNRAPELLSSVLDALRGIVRGKGPDSGHTSS